MPEVDPAKAIDREVEQEEFGKMLLFQDDARLLVIGDKPGTGKSTLLRRLRYNCVWQYRVPVSLVLLEANLDPNQSIVTSPIELVNWIRQDLQDTGLSLPKYDFLNYLRLQFILPSIAQSLQGVQSYLEHYAQASKTQVYGEANADTISGGVVAGIYVKELNLTPQTSWARPENERIASQKCIEAFFDDLREACAQQPVVLLFDTYEQCVSGLAEWITDGFIRPLTLLPATRPTQLLVVLAGHEDRLPDFAQRLGPQFDRLVRFRPLAQWEEQHVRDFLAVHEFGELSNRDFEIVYEKVCEGWSLRDALKLAQVLLLPRKLGAAP